jgi:cell wall-associated NlpC family hydrolase
MNGLITMPVVPVRSSGNNQSEMISQLLFGEMVSVGEQDDKWIHITALSDSVSGWIDKKMLKILTDAEFQKSQKLEKFPLSRPYNIIYNIRINQTKLVPGGSIIYGLDGDDFRIGSEKWSLIEPVEKPELPYPVHQLLEIAADYLNAPALWGGKTILGMDCSGFTQLIFSISGYQIPRFAAGQVESGINVDFLSEALPGDLAFFEDAEGRIDHVGILLDATKIIHVSGCVKIEHIDSQGIISAESGEYTHQLRVIRRIIE